MSPRVLFCLWRTAIVAGCAYGVGLWFGREPISAVVIGLCGLLLGAETVAIFAGTRRTR